MSVIWYANHINKKRRLQSKPFLFNNKLSKQYSNSSYNQPEILLNDLSTSMATKPYTIDHPTTSKKSFNKKRNLSNYKKFDFFDIDSPSTSISTLALIEAGDDEAKPPLLCNVSNKQKKKIIKPSVITLKLKKSPIFNKSPRKIFTSKKESDISSNYSIQHRYIPPLPLPNYNCFVNF